MKSFLGVSRRKGCSLRAVGTIATTGNSSSSSVLRSSFPFSTAPQRNEVPTAATSIPTHHETKVTEATKKPKQQFDYLDPLLLSTLLSEEERLVSDTAKSFCDDILFPTIIQANRNETFDPNLMKQMGQLGFLGSKLHSSIFHHLYVNPLQVLSSLSGYDDPSSSISIFTYSNNLCLFLFRYY